MTRPASRDRDQNARKAATALPQLALLGGDPRWWYSLRGCLYSIPGVRLSDSLGARKASDRPLAMTRAIGEAHVLG
jgi:hypothetical protein